VNQFFLDFPDAFEVDTKYNDFFGRNASFNPNGYLRKKALATTREDERR
jgi:hypothetical protein